MSFLVPDVSYSNLFLSGLGLGTSG